ncbi:hypothetical protein ACI3E1_07525 [Ligilactobacillus sp. LYQ139]|uniref:hypothetical protein n=1 Tax=Ligilactobacillus sp. LYQ139 TaxID=3378800 RepID=UPI0038534276
MAMTKDEYLQKFVREKEVRDVFGVQPVEAGNKVVEVLKKEDLTYEQAYAALQFAYNKLKFESNFLRLS